MINIIPIKDLKNTSEISEKVHKTNGPIYVTKNGYGDMVLMSIENYQKILHEMEMLRELDLAEKDIKEGRYKDGETFLKELNEDYGL